jgi:hypothetical protein
MSKLSQKTDNYMQGFKEHCKNTTLILLFKINMCYEFKILMTDKSFSLCSKCGTEIYRNYQREIKLWCKGSTSWQPR